MAVLFNTVLVEKLPIFELVILICHVAAYIAFEVVLLLVGPQSSRREVFNQWENEYEWSSISTAVLIGRPVGPWLEIINADSVVRYLRPLLGVLRLMIEPLNRSPWRQAPFEECLIGVTGHELPLYSKPLHSGVACSI